MELEEIQAAVLEAGLRPRGGFHPLASDAVPPMPGGRPAATLILLGNAGPEMWEAFQRAPEAQSPRHPLDEWSRRIITVLAESLSGRPLFPFSPPPFLPFQRWARKAEPVWPSPIGLLIHPEYGSWHAYRGALAFADRIDLPPGEPVPAPCDSCAERPCLSACPVEAFGDGQYDVPACVARIGSREGADCMDRGCLARRACPVGREYRYRPAQARFHMSAFLRAHRGPRDR